MFRRFSAAALVLSLFSLQVRAAQFDAKSYVVHRVQGFHQRVFGLASHRPCESMLTFRDSLMDGLGRKVGSGFSDPRLREIAQKAYREAMQQARSEELAGVNAERERIADTIRKLAPKANEYVPGDYTTSEAIQHDLLMYLLDEFIKVENEATIQQGLDFLYHPGTTYGVQNWDGPEGRAYRIIHFISDKMNLATGTNQIAAFKQFTNALLTPEEIRYAVMESHIHSARLLLGLMKERGNPLFTYFYDLFRKFASDEELRIL